MLSILLATYNGAPYLPEQIGSILAQSHRDFTLYIADDGSTDDTLAIAGKYAHQYPSKVVVVRNEKNSGSAKSNFMDMAARHMNDYVMFCDQDDVWLEDKVALTLAKMRELESENPPGTPILVHTDLTVVGEDLSVIDESLFHMQRMDVGRTRLRQLVVQNMVTGCTVMVNRALLEITGSIIPDGAIMHDWWLTLVACCFGKIGFVEMPTILYRQHGGNAVGAKDARSIGYKFHLLRTLPQVKKNIADTYRQAGCFLDCYRERLSPEQISILSQYAGIPEKRKIGRCLTAWRLGTVKNGLIRKLVSILYL